ncbi:TIM barrel protein, partial [Clostridium paraputrificum]|uniref:TIM barrel protein n=1 Tax=Clostridium paraputrificum TaxID=29363 RepID=UPI0034A43085
DLKKLPYFGVDYRLETTGKGTQFGDIDELIHICKEIDTCKLCIDFAHVHARGNGALKEYDDFARILEKVGEGLGREALDDLHIHLAGISYSEKGEKHHLPFLESDFNYQACMKAFVDYEVKGCVICESPILERDAKLLKDTYESL